MELDRLLEPRSIAVVGATDRPSSYGNIILQNLERLEFRGDVWGINPGRTAVRDTPCFPSLEDMPAAADAVAIAVPAATVPATVAKAAEIGCGGAVVISAGFGEVEGGRQLERDLRSTAVEAAFPVCGPNGNGIVSYASGFAVWGDSVGPMPRGHVAMVSQSGNVAVNALGVRRGIGFHTVVSSGNGAVCDPADWLAALAERDGVRSVALFLESDGDGAKLAEGLARCAERSIGVAVLKVGSSEAGGRAAAAHTGALAGDQRVFRSLIEEAGAAWTQNPHELLEVARVLAEPKARPRGDGGLAILTCSGGDSGIAADEADRLGVELPPLGEATKTRLRELLPDAATVSNPLDYTSLLWGQTELLHEIVETVANDPAIDQALVFHDTPQDLPAESVESFRETRDGLAGGLESGAAAPLLASTLPELIGEEIALELAQRGITSVAGLTTAILCARELRRPLSEPDRLRDIAMVAATRPPSVASRHTEYLEATFGAEGWLSEADAKTILAGAGISVPASRSVLEAEGAVQAAEALGYPVALKLSSPSIQHKSDIGAISLGLADADAVRAEARLMLNLPEARGAELMVEAMAPAGVELFVAARADAVVPALVIGVGGVWAEALDDVTIVPLPATPARVREALTILKAAPLMTGARGADGIDVEAVIEIAARLGELLIEENLSLIEVNPLIATADGAIAADALIRR